MNQQNGETIACYFFSYPAKHVETKSNLDEAFSDLNLLMQKAKVDLPFPLSVL